MGSTGPLLQKLLSASNIHTPLLLIHGDLDYVDITQAEEMFRSLERQGKPVRFVRYWGEEHVFSNPKNIVDVWDQIFAWFEKFQSKTN